MDLDDRLLGNLRKIDRDHESQNLYYAEEPDWMIYETRKKETPLNAYRGVFTEKDERSINTAPSVFEKGTLFKTD